MASRMFAYDEQMTDMILDLCRARLSEDPVPLDYGGAVDVAELRGAIDGLITDGGTDARTVLDIFDGKLARALVSCDSPRFLAFIPAAPTKASLLFDMVVASSSVHATSWIEAAGPIVAENQALSVLAGLAGLPSTAGGCFVAGGSAGNLSGLMVARDTAGHRMGRTPDRPLVAISEEAHSSVGKALRVLGIEALPVPTNDHRMTGEGVRSTLERHPRGRDTVAVVATAGTTNAGIIDDLAGVGAVARERNLWFHVDGAYGCAALFAPSVRERFAGIELVDSFVVDPHKWLYAPFDCAALIYREPNLAKAVHTQDASYLDVIHPPDDAEVWNPSDYAYHLTRRARGLPIWFSMAVYGLDAYRDAVERVLTVTRRTADLITTTPHLELLRPPELSVVLFRRPGWDRADYERWSDELLEAQQGFVLHTTWEGETVGRLAFLHPDTTMGMVEEILAGTA